MRVLILTLALAACAHEAPQDAAPPEATDPANAETALDQMPSWADAREAGVDFRGVGQEPGWLLDIYQRDRIRLLWDYGEHLADFPLTEPTYPQEGATRYATQAAGTTLTITIRRHPCQDAMSGAAYPASVEIAIDGRTLNGCGKTV